MCLISEQRHYHIANKIFLYAAGTIETELQDDDLWGDYRYLIDAQPTGMGLDLIVDVHDSGNITFTEEVRDQVCFICMEQVTQADKWLFPCRRHGCHLQSFARLKAQNAARYKRVFFDTEEPDEKIPGHRRCQVYTYCIWDPMPDQCTVCCGATSPAIPFLLAHCPSNQHLYAQLNLPSVTNWFHNTGGILMMTGEWRELGPVEQKWMDEVTLAWEEPIPCVDFISGV